MKNLFNQFLKEAKVNASTTAKKGASKPEVISKLTALFSKWLSGYKDKQKTVKRFQSSYRVNKFMVRKWINKLAA